VSSPWSHSPHPADLDAASHAFVADLAHPELTSSDAHHLFRVLRLRPGETVSVSDGRGRFALCVVGSHETLEPAGEIVTMAERRVITIGFAILKGDRNEWVVQKLTELGVDRIVPFTAAHCVVKWDATKAAKNLERLAEVARLAAMQSRQAWMPQIGLGTDSLATFSDVAALEGVSLAQFGGRELLAGDTTAVLVGPEGGWSSDELLAVAGHVSLVPSVLRAETASLAAGVLLCAGRSSR
jgi:16S rRNA (uracil1498-N3)-methyltransferase